MDLYSVLTGAVPHTVPGAAAIITRDGVVVDRAALGEMVRYAGPGGALAAERPRVTADTLWDLASVTKLYTTVLVLRLGLDLDEPVHRRYTMRQLLTHTAGLPATVPEHLRTWPGVLALPGGGPDVYSDVGPLLAGRIVEERTGTPLDRLLRELVTGPLGLAETTYAPDPARTAATEFKPGRGLVRGEVHDGTAFALGGPCGHAGLFAPVGEVAAFGEALRTGFCPGVADLPNLRDGDGFGHTGFTGTSVRVTDRSVAVLLTNRVHPRRELSSVAGLRAAVRRLQGAPPAL
ncbi:serine hydrolase domain-containing protein [Longispora sp. K20-0274]|uniref:serine hydrolase domain-containing protein n=1 Tax=Longispora sp. K20-0274 TaxID=3088255 RepID=UPI00399BAA75